MGCSLSCKILSSPSKIKNIRIVHLNGYVEELEFPVTVAQVTGKPPHHFLFTQAQLLAAASTPLKSDSLLEPGRAYFLLPYTLFDTNVSPVDFAPLARKLAAVAQKSRLKSSKSREQNLCGNSPVWSSPARSPNWQFSDRSGAKSDKNDEVFHGMQSSSKLRSWKPLLSTIREISFTRRSESDVQENVKVDSTE